MSHNNYPKRTRDSWLTAGGAALVLGTLVMLVPRGQNTEVPVSAQSDDERNTTCVPSGSDKFTFEQGMGPTDARIKIGGPVGKGEACHTETMQILKGLIGTDAQGSALQPQPGQEIIIPVRVDPTTPHP